MISSILTRSECILELQILDSIVSHRCFLRECSVQHSIVGILHKLQSISVGENTKIRSKYNKSCTFIVLLVVVQTVEEEGDMPEEGFCIRSVIAVVVKNATIRDGLIV
ncbi:hypothetical protein IGI04_031975 [Brassica rapa subsp. trilocularis]|uniref:glucose-1-phosphate adenylyltransferase n=1 Tax=Brassica rapa subsp. trilocularis TaxID=1813537 RepID=A0ABQ7LYG6_BRACM|nr:hypothetical protein IGI04_031975 [Brassica rapa subsp. trilocularis]